MDINPSNEDLCVNIIIFYAIKNTIKKLDKLDICGEMFFIGYKLNKFAVK